MPSSIHYLASSVKYKQTKNILLTPSLSNIALIEASAKIETGNRDHHALAFIRDLKQPQQRMRQELHRFAHLTMKKWNL